MSLGAIDWSRPWLAPYRERGLQAAASILDGASVAEALNALLVAPIELAAGRLRFVRADGVPSGEPYEAFIARTACVPTRNDRHDFFNGLVWLYHAPLKRRLNELQAAAIERHGVGAARGALRDAATLFDENGALIEAPRDLMDALRARQWKQLFVDQRARWPVDVRLTLVGHALLDKLVHPYKSITAHVWLGAMLDAPTLATKPFAPLPVLGVPLWWRANQAPEFYDDAAVFRAARQPSAGRKPSTDK